MNWMLSYTKLVLVTNYHFSGINSEGRLVGQWCGNTSQQAPPKMALPSDNVWLAFVTDGSESNHGFNLSYSVKGEYRVGRGKYRADSGKYIVDRGKYRVNRGKSRVDRGKYIVNRGKYSR